MAARNFITVPGSQFIPTGVGAVERTISAKLQETVSIKDFGAVGDGVTDDTIAIQTAVSQNIGRRILFPSGTYKITSSINLFTEIPTKRTIICGESNAVIDATSLSDFAFVLSTPNSGYEFPAPIFLNLIINCQKGIRLNSLTGGFTDDGSSQCYMKKPGFYNVTLNGTGGSGSFGLQLSKCFNIEISNCAVIGFETCIKCKGSDFTLIEHTRISTGTTLINDEQAGSFGSGTVITKCDMGNVATGGWFISTNARESEISNTMMENFSSTIQGFVDITGGYTHRLYSNRFDSSSTLPISIRSVPTLLALIVRDNLSVSNNPAAAVFTSDPTYFYNAVLKRQVVFENNSFSSPQTLNVIPNFQPSTKGFILTPNTGGFDYADAGGLVTITPENSFAFDGTGPYTFRIPSSYRFINGLVFIEAKAAVDGQQAQIKINGINTIKITLTTSYARYFIGVSGSETYTLIPVSGSDFYVRSLSFESYSGSPSFTLPVSFSSGTGTGRTFSVTIPCFVISGTETPGIGLDTYLFTQGGSDDSTLVRGIGLADGSSVITTSSLLGGSITTKTSVSDNILTITFDISDAFNGGSNAIVRGSLGVSLYTG